MSYKGKTLMLGNAGVGKTSILTRFIDGKFLDSYVQTVGANFYIKEVDLTHIIDKINLDQDIKEKIKESNFKVYWWDIPKNSTKFIPIKTIYN